MSLEEKKLLEDIIQCIASIDEHLDGKRILTGYLAKQNCTASG